jgi:hypothetical protein
MNDSTRQLVINMLLGASILLLLISSCSNSVRTSALKEETERLKLRAAQLEWVVDSALKAHPPVVMKEGK